MDGSKDSQGYGSGSKDAKTKEGRKTKQDKRKVGGGRDSSKKYISGKAAAASAPGLTVDGGWVNAGAGIGEDAGTHFEASSFKQRVTINVPVPFKGTTMANDFISGGISGRKISDLTFQENFGVL